ncbi:TetR/AcrR family transcriptional regulator [Stutzerimonas kunmingensis]|uniref:TetR/AcrR family transcriptional regulator n=1 Tax=Stutzerimonas kunmingensis TaxID=1211807 RepID=UPI001E5054BA|nr:TetR/AcrR family transcriptional regulator [Stutzerimonas kunmingensis]MCB4796119.1 TetR/AcrR family transcriptional regulator [Pseudomonas sp. NP21570]WOF79239.1 TetR/AcrR family transcriptional regulator [Pseudomonas sp. FeN3W]HBO6206960.1 TetR/AcrR family transcriptional regulator [Pseudomonas aeruginosa]HCG1306217.1 TetR/AcrR family transcriptional regulator [Pseudomonas aeruginosa]HCG1307152.1 TetR/AcrR family transcriptional regulator [Pseudomonas aeruginosa]
MSLTAQDERLLKALAVAIVDRPRATVKELAEAAGVSKATLHRFCGTRDNLDDMLMSYAEQVFNQIISNCELDSAEPLGAIRKLLSEHLMHREMMIFLTFHYTPDSLDPDEDANWQPYMQALDAFFLRAQQAGVLRIDLSASVLTELFLSLIFGIVDAERRGRAASSSSLNALEQMFLYGASTAG